MSGQSLESKFIGCMIGSAIGDAIGELAFHFHRRGELIEEVDRVETLRYTDDTAMAIGLAQSLIETGGIDPERVGRKFHENYVAEPYRGYASGPPTIFSAVESTRISYVQAAKLLFQGNGSFGNGSAMRVAPVGLFYHGSPELAAMAMVSAEVTHSHVLGRHGAALQAAAVSQALSLTPGEPFSHRKFTEGLLSLGLDSELHARVEIIRTLIEKDADCPAAIGSLGKSVAVHESLPYSIFSFLKHPASFRECLFCAILYGGDRDTLGAMAGALSGACLGLDGIPPEWEQKLENRGYIRELAVALLESSR